MEKTLPTTHLLIERLQTERLELVPFTLPTATAILEGKLEVLDDLGLQTDDRRPDTEALNTLPNIIRNLKLEARPTSFESWMIALRSNKTIIGDAGFKGLPNSSGEIDLGYAIIEEEQRKGYGFEAAHGLAKWALAQPEVKHITAKCLLANTASARVLEKLGMRETHRDSEMIQWKFSKGHYKFLQAASPALP